MFRFLPFVPRCWLSLISCLLVCRAFGQRAAELPIQSQAIADVIGFYQTYISGIRPDECPMIPSCSRYGMGQFQTKPTLTAFLNTSDRLMRCGHDHRRYGLYAQGGMVKLVDTGSKSEDARLRFRFARPLFAFADTADVPASLGFIQHLMNQHYYDQALLEISRVLYTKQMVNNKTLYINYIRCLKAKGDYEKITYEYEVSFPAALRDDPDVRLEVGQVWMQLENYANARAMLQLPPGTVSPTSFSDRVHLLNGLIAVRQFDWPGSRRALASVNPNSSAYDMAQSATAILTNAERLPTKKPAVAGTLAIVPGAGYFYAGHRQTALTALLLNSLLGYATYTTLRTRNYGLAGLTGAFGLAFYTGNITGSVKSARRYNLQQKQILAGSIERMIQIY